jgi:diguanylate cyclase (GGDEF)-like protein
VANIALLLVEDSIARADLIRSFLGKKPDFPHTLTVARHFKQAKNLLTSRSFDLILLDLALPDSPWELIAPSGVQQLQNLPPIIVLTDLDDSNLALDAVRQGAQDHLVYGQFDGGLLERAILYAIERHRIQQENQKELQLQIEREKFLGRTVERIRQSLDLESILQTAVEEVLQFLEADRVLIFRCKDGENGAILAEAPSSSYLVPGKVKLSAAILKWLSTRNSATAFPQSAPPDSDWSELVNTLVNSVLTVPIWENKNPHETQLWGQLLACFYHEPPLRQDWELRFLRHLADQVAIAIRQSKLYEQSKRQAAVDSLTGVANRRIFDRKLVQEWRRSRREQTPMSLLMCDIDYFKQYNDSYGHLQGDRCLQRVAAILRNAVKRPADLVARYGGEEFALILPKTDLEGAMAVANSIREALVREEIAHRDSGVSSRVTLSIGLATQIPDRVRTNSEILLRQADRALLLAKQQGRDRIVTA